MLYEIKHVHQKDPGLRLRWFTAESCNSDLYVWEDVVSREITRFQFYFYSSVVEWRGGDRLWFGAVEDEPQRGPKAAPMIVRSDAIDLEEALAIFRYKGREIEPSLRNFIEERLFSHIAETSYPEK